MKIVVPLRVQPVAADGLRGNEARVIEVAFGDEVKSAVQELGPLVSCAASSCKKGIAEKSLMV